MKPPPCQLAFMKGGKNTTTTRQVNISFLPWKNISSHHNFRFDITGGSCPHKWQEIHVPRKVSMIKIDAA